MNSTALRERGDDLSFMLDSALQGESINTSGGVIRESGYGAFDRLKSHAFEERTVNNRPIYRSRTKISIVAGLEAAWKTTF